MSHRQAALAAADPRLRSEVLAVLAEIWTGRYGIEDTASRLVGDVFASWLTPPTRQPVHQFTPAHLRLVFLLAESQGSTHTRLRRAWDAKSARTGSAAWPWISDSGIRTRVSELVKWGLVEWSGAWGETAAGRRSRVWQLTGHNPRAVGRPADPVPGFDRVPLEAAYADLQLEAGRDVTISSQLLVALEVAGASA